MLNGAIYGMVYCGAALMVYNIIGFLRFARFIRKLESWKTKNGILYVPVILLIFFLIGYLVIGFLGNPDIMTAGILFGGSVFVFIIYHLLTRITRQILERDRLEKELLEAEEVSRTKTMFLSSISHEMRTPLNVIMGLTKIARKDPGISPATEDHLSKIELSANHMLGLINNILDLNQLKRGEMAVKNEPFSLREMLDQIDAVTGTVSREKGLSYNMSCSDALQDACIGDMMQIKHILASILDNSLKYTNAPGTISLSADLDSLSESNEQMVQMVRFCISDTGIGIDSSFLPKIFDGFEQEDASATNPYGGSGLSLAVTKSLVELMGGTIEVESEKGKGSAFTVRIPLTYTESAAEEAAAEEEEQVTLEGRRILIVEDIPENAEIVADLLELEGVETEHAENGQIAVDMFRESEEGYYDAVLMDLRMPVMDGLEATRQIRALDRSDAKSTPVIALTANAFESDIKQSLDAGMDAHLAKPADSDLLYDTLKRLISRRNKA